MAIVIWPKLATGVVVQGTTTAWTWGGNVTIVPTNTFSKPCELMGIGIENVLTIGAYALQISSQSKTLATVRFNRVGAITQSLFIPIFGADSVKSNEAVFGNLAGSSAVKNMTVSLYFTEE